MGPVMISEIALMKPHTSMSAIDRDFLCILSLFCVMGICTTASSFLNDVLFKYFGVAGGGKIAEWLIG